MLVPTAMVREPLNFRALTEGKPWTLLAHSKRELNVMNWMWRLSLVFPGAAVSHTLSPEWGCSGRSPGSPLGSEHEGPNTQLCPGGQTEGDVTVSELRTQRLKKWRFKTDSVWIQQALTFWKMEVMFQLNKMTAWKSNEINWNIP